MNTGDTLSGSFTSTSSPAFTNAGLGSVSALAAGQSDTNPAVTFSTAAVGTFTEVITFDPAETNASDVSTTGAPVTLTVTGTVIPNPGPVAIAWGDVHITTFDGLAYNFQAEGEFTLAKSTAAGDSFDVQARLQPYYSSASVSVMTQVAASVGTDRVTFDPSRADVVWVDGVASALSAGDPTIALDGGVLKWISVSQYEIQWTTGESLLVSNSGQYLNVTTYLGPNAEPGTVQGLLGADDGQANDFRLADGSVLVQPLTSAMLYGAYADAWRVTQATSLFDYGTGQTTATFTDANFPGDVVPLSNLPASVTQAAAAAVANAGITDPTIAADAELDYVETGSPTFLAAAQTAAGETSAPTPATVVATSPSGGAPAAVGVAAAESDVHVSAGVGGSATFDVYLTAAQTSATTVTWSVIDPAAGDLGAGAFGGTLPGGQLSIAAGETSASFTVALAAGALGSAPAGVLEVEIGAPSGAPIVAPTAQTSVISSEAEAGPPAEPALSVLSALGTLVETGDSYTLNLGTLSQGETVSPIAIAISNDATAPADSLAGAFAVSDSAGFGVSGVAPLSPIAAGASYTGLEFEADTSALGANSETVTFSPIDENASGYSAPLSPITLTVEDTVAAAPTITGTVAGQHTTSEAPVTPFSGVTITDANGGATDTLTISIGGTGGTLSGTGLTGGTGGVYALTGVASSLTRELDALSFTPTAGPPNSSSTSTFTLSDLSSAYGTPAVDTRTTVVDLDPRPVASIAAPASEVMRWGVATAVTGVSLTDSNSAGTFTVVLSDTSGFLTATGSAPKWPPTTTLTITGSLAQVNAELATLRVTELIVGADALTITATGPGAAVLQPATVAVSANGGPTVSAPATSTATEGQATAVSGVVVAEAGASTAGETFTASLSDTTGLLAVTASGGAVVTGEGAEALTVSGSLAAVNQTLATLTDTEGQATTDSLRVSAVDSLGGTSAAGKTAISIDEVFHLTTAADDFVGGAGPDTFIAASGTLSSGDVLTGAGGTNTLDLQGAGTFDLTAPSTVTGIQVIEAQEMQPGAGGSGSQTVDLRAGMNGVTVDVAAASLDAQNPNAATITILGAANNDVINLASGNDVVVVGSRQETVNGGSGVDTIEVTSATIGGTINGGATGRSTLMVTGGGTIGMGSNITGVATVDLAAAASPYHFTANAASGLVLDDLDTANADTLTAGAAGQTLSGGGAGKVTFVGYSSGVTVFEAASANFNGDTVEGFLSGDLLEFDGLATSGVSVAYAAITASKGTLTVKDNGALVARVTLFGQMAAGTFAPEASANGTVIVDSAASSPALQHLIAPSG